VEIINRLLKPGELKKYIAKKRIIRPVDKIILHHTSNPVKNWVAGERSTLYYKKMYEEMEWEEGPHFFGAPEGIWLFTDINTEGVHANDANVGSIGVEIVGEYDDHLPKGIVWQNTQVLLRALLNKYDLPAQKVFFHRTYNRSKTCPGKAITKKWLLRELQ